MRNYFTFDDIDSRDYGVYISGSGVYNAPRRLYEAVHVPGRNGDLILAGDSYENIEVTYPCWIASNFRTNMQNFRNALLAKDGYQQLKDSYDPDHTRYGVFMEEIEVKPTSRLNAGEFEITFNCKPQRYSNTGLQSRRTAYSIDWNNPSPFISLPKITIWGYGTLQLISGGMTQEITVASAFDRVIIDSELQDCYSGTSNANEYVSFGGDNPNNSFPVVYPGNFILKRKSGEANISQLAIQPRWFDL